MGTKQVSRTVRTLKDAADFTKKHGFPVLLSPSFTLGDRSRLASTAEQLNDLLPRLITLSPVREVLVVKVEHKE